MNRQSVRRQILAILETILVVGSAVLVVWLSTTYAGLASDAVQVSLFLVPIIVYMISSGRLSELRAGGLEAKFVHVAEDSVKVEVISETIEASVQQMEMVAKAGATELQSQIHQLDESKPIILTLTLGREGYYDRHVWLRYMEALSQYRTFKFVVILDPEDKFVAYIFAWAMLQILRTEGLGDMFVQIINEGNIKELRRYPGVVTRTISTKSTNVQALSEMTTQNLEALVVIDEDRRLRGVVEREQLLSKLLLGMAR